MLILAGLFSSGRLQVRKPRRRKKRKKRNCRSGKVEFATDEGTWMSLDVSPDGKQLVVVSGRERRGEPLACRGRRFEPKAAHQGP